MGRIVLLFMVGEPGESESKQRMSRFIPPAGSLTAAADASGPAILANHVRVGTRAPSARFAAPDCTSSRASIAASFAGGS